VWDEWSRICSLGAILSRLLSILEMAEFGVCLEWMKDGFGWVLVLFQLFWVTWWPWDETSGMRPCAPPVSVWRGFPNFHATQINIRDFEWGLEGNSCLVSEGNSRDDGGGQYLRTEWEEPEIFTNYQSPNYRNQHQQTTQQYFEFFPFIYQQMTWDSSTKRCTPSVPSIPHNLG